MATYFRQVSRRANALGLSIMASLALVSAWAGVRFAGTKTGTVLALTAALGPPLFWLAITAPILFPFGAYTFVAPFDSLLALNNASGATTVTAVLGAVSACALLFYGLRTKRFADPDASVGVWFIYTLWIVASAFWAIDSNRTLELLPTALELFGLYAAVSLIRVGPRELSTILKLTAAGGTCAALYLLYLAHTGMAVHEDRMYLRTESQYWNPDFLATSLILPLIIAISGAAWSRKLFARIASLAAIAIMVPAIVLTGARGPELGIFAGVAYLVARDKNRWKLAGLFAALLAAAAIFFPASFTSRWANALNDGGAGRTDIWRVGWLAFKHNWLYGAGFNNFAQAYNQVFIQVFQPLDVGWSHVSHNIIVGNSVELGSIGLLMLLAGWFVQFRTLRHVGPQDPRYPVRLSLEAALIALFISGLFADIMTVKFSWLAFILINLTRNTAMRADARIANVTPAVAAASQP